MHFQITNKNNEIFISNNTRVMPVNMLQNTGHSRRKSFVNFTVQQQQMRQHT